MLKASVATAALMSVALFIMSPREPFAYEKFRGMLHEPENCLSDQNATRKTVMAPYSEGSIEFLTCPIGRAMIFHDHLPWADKSEIRDFDHVFVKDRLTADRLNWVHAINYLALRYDDRDSQLCKDGHKDWGSLKRNRYSELVVQICDMEIPQDFYLVDTNH